VATTPKDLSKNNQESKSKTSTETGPSISAQILSALTELWYRENGHSSIYVAQTLDEVGVEKIPAGGGRAPFWNIIPVTDVTPSMFQEHLVVPGN